MSMLLEDLKKKKNKNERNRHPCTFDGSPANDSVSERISTCYAISRQSSGSLASLVRFRFTLGLIVSYCLE